VGEVKGDNLRQGTCSGKRLLQIEIAISATVEGRRGRGVGNSLILMRSATLFVSCHFVFINAYYLGVHCVPVCGIFSFF
jgi:hypothetical protein